VDTALREAEEETGLSRSLVAPLGFLGRYDTITGYRMTAVVGVVQGPVEFVPDRSEVDEVFCVALEYVADPDQYSHQHVQYQGENYHLLTLNHARHRIWGATAALLYQFGQTLNPDASWRADAV
ncbi:MAG: CoA pyrophosphatase, partial [Pseudomonadota bacterium]